MSAPAVVVGASLAGLRAAEALRARGWEGELVMVGAEPHMPYTRPPLSKALLGGALEPAGVELECEGVDAEWRLGVTATGLDPERRLRSDLDRRLQLTERATARAPATGRSG